MEKIYTTEQAAKALQVSIVTIRRYIKSGKPPASKLGKDYRIQESDLAKLLQQTKVNG